MILSSACVSSRWFVHFRYFAEDKDLVYSFCQEFGKPDVSCENVGHSKILWPYSKVIFTDSCLKRADGSDPRHPGIGGIWCDGSNSHMFSYGFRIKLFFENNDYEMSAIYVAAKLWGPQWHDKVVLAYCDSQATVNLINGMRHRGSRATRYLLTLIKEIEKLYNFNLVCKHIKGKKNFKADRLARYPVDDALQKGIFGSTKPVVYDAGPIVDELGNNFANFTTKK